MRSLAFTGVGEAATAVLLNNTGCRQDVTVNGAGLPDGSWELYRTGQGFNCVREGTCTIRRRSR